MAFRMCYFAIRVRDMDESVRFYTEVFGMEHVEAVVPAPPTQGRIATLKSSNSDQLLELNWYEPGSRWGPPYTNGEELDHLAFDCEDLERAVDELQRKGLKVVFRLKEVGGWNEAFVKDPNGIWIELLQRKK